MAQLDVMQLYLLNLRPKRLFLRDSHTRILVRTCLYTFTSVEGRQTRKDQAKRAQLTVEAGVAVPCEEHDDDLLRVLVQPAAYLLQVHHRLLIGPQEVNAIPRSKNHTAASPSERRETQRTAWLHTPVRSSVVLHDAKVEKAHPPVELLGDV